MSDSERLQRRVQAIVFYGEQLLANQDTEGMKHALDVARRALPLLRKATWFDPTKGLREAWYLMQRELGLPEPV